MLRQLASSKFATRPQPCKRKKPKAGSITHQLVLTRIGPLKGAKSAKPNPSHPRLTSVNFNMTRKSWRSGRPMKTIGATDRRIKRHAGQHRGNAKTPIKPLKTAKGV